MTRMQGLDSLRPIVVVLAAGLQVELPTVAADRHLHDLGGALVDRGDADVALIFSTMYSCVYP